MTNLLNIRGVHFSFCIPNQWEKIHILVLITLHLKEKNLSISTPRDFESGLDTIEYY